MTSRSKASSFSPSMKPLGILGGGQLARMMALKAHELGIKIAVLSEKRDDPAAEVVGLHTLGKLDDSKTLEEFLSSCSTVTFESEFLDAELLSRIAKKTGTAIYPDPQHMAAIQDRLTQKELLVTHGLPTSPFVAVSTEADARAAAAKLGLPLVFKRRRFGYDGYGTFVVRSEKDLTAFIAAELLPVDRTNAMPSLKHTAKASAATLASPSIGAPAKRENAFGFIAEKFIPFRREVALMIARGRDGKALHLPFVETFQENSRCLWVKGPLAKTAGREALARKLERFLARVGYVGIMGVELFDTGKELIVNELAPRVHNSGHYSLDALSEDQFTLHIKAVLGLKLEEPKALAKGFAMWNLLGSTSKTPTWKLPADACLHWYGKADNRAGRKMGHLNALGATPEKALALVRRHRKYFKL